MRIHQQKAKAVEAGHLDIAEDNHVERPAGCKDLACSDAIGGPDDVVGGAEYATRSSGYELPSSSTTKTRVRFASSGGAEYPTELRASDARPQGGRTTHGPK